MATVAKRADRCQAYPDPIPSILSFGSLNLLAGASGVGKTCLTSWLITRLQGGLDVFGYPTSPPTRIGFLSADRGAATAKHWLSLVGDPDIAFYSISDDPTFKPERLRSPVQLLAIFEECLTKLALPPGAFLIVDPIALFMRKLNDYHTCAVDCLMLRRIVQAHQLTLLGLCHAGKQKGDRKERYVRLEDRINGSGALLGYGDTQMYLASPQETGQSAYTFAWRSHTAPEQSFALGRSKAGLFVPWEQSVEAADESVVYAALPEDGAPLPVATIFGLCSALSRASVFRKLKQLVDDGLVERAAEGIYRRVKVN